MNPARVKIYTDEDVDKDLAIQLRNHGYDALSCQEAGKANAGRSDEEQLQFASQAGRAILVFNKKDYIPIDRAWKTRGEDHHGIILADQLRLSELVRRTRKHLDAITAAQQHNTVLYLAR